MARTLVVAAVSARLLAETAAREGLRVIAIDAFGDADTRRAAALCLPLAAASARCAPTPSWCSSALRRCGDEPERDRLDRRRRLRRRAGLARPGRGDAATARHARRGGARAARSRALASATLERLGIAHPPRFAVAARRTRRLAAEGRCSGSGGWQVRAAAGHATTPRPGEYFQRELAGTPMSAAVRRRWPRGVRADRLQRLLCAAIGERRHVYRRLHRAARAARARRARALDAAAALAPALGAARTGRSGLPADWPTMASRCSSSTRGRRPAWRCTPSTAWSAPILRACGVPARTASARPPTTGCAARHRDRLRAARAAARRRGRRRALGGPSRCARSAARRQPLRGRPSRCAACRRTGNDASALRAALAATRDALLDELEMHPMSTATTHADQPQRDAPHRWSMRWSSVPTSCGCAWHASARGVHLVDAGIDCRGGIEAGLLIAEICMGGLGRGRLRPATAAVWPTWLRRAAVRSRCWPAWPASTPAGA